jgi:class 3 adenylate cyclase
MRSPAAWSAALAFGGAAHELHLRPRHPNAGKRLQENAIANQILICPATYEAVSDAVVVKPMGPMMLKGRVTPVQAYEVLGLK